MDSWSIEAIKDFLDEKSAKYNHTDFIETDPIKIPHAFNQKEDIEVSGFLTALIAWGNRKAIIKSAQALMQLMGNEPFRFVCEAGVTDKNNLLRFVHRTFNAHDLLFLLDSLKRLYLIEGGMEKQFASQSDIPRAISKFRQTLLSGDEKARTAKHLADPMNGSAAKRINMFLRWMARRDTKGVDFGIWKTVDPAFLRLPLDVHTGNTARKLNLLNRRQNDARAVEDITHILRLFDPRDPVKYDFALFGLGAFEGF